MRKTDPPALQTERAAHILTSRVSHDTGAILLYLSDHQSPGKDHAKVGTRELSRASGLRTARVVQLMDWMRKVKILVVVSDGGASCRRVWRHRINWKRLKQKLPAEPAPAWWSERKPKKPKKPKGKVLPFPEVVKLRA